MDTKENTSVSQSDETAIVNVQPPTWPSSCPSGEIEAHTSETIPCRVCGDTSTGKFYGVRSCDGCKLFFRRSQSLKDSYECSLAFKNCPVDRLNRNRCLFCRFHKCLRVGMSQDKMRLRPLLKMQKELLEEEALYLEANKDRPWMKIDLDNFKNSCGEEPAIPTIRGRYQQKQLNSSGKNIGVEATYKPPSSATG